MDAFQQEAVRLVLAEGKTVTAVARELDLVGWALVGEARAGGSGERTSAERDELVLLRRALRIAEEGRHPTNESRALERPDLWARHSVAYAHSPRLWPSALGDITSPLKTWPLGGLRACPW